MAERKRTLGALAAISSALLLLAASSAWADQQSKTDNGALPGVRPQKPIASHDGVYPPEPDAPQADDPTSFHIGEMKIQVHGYISYAVGFGKPMPGRGSRNN
jgi:hypothetical protein